MEATILNKWVGCLATVVYSLKRINKVKDVFSKVIKVSPVRMRSLEIPQQPVNWMGKEVEYFFFSPQFQHCPAHTNHKAAWDSKLTLRKIQSTQSWLAVLAGTLQMRSIQALMITKCWRLACSTRRLAKFVICLMMSIPLTCTGFQRLEAPRSKQDRMCLLWLLQMVSQMNTNSQVFLVSQSQNSDIILLTPH